MSNEYEDGEVIGIDKDGGLILWNADTQQGYNCGETLEEFTRNGAILTALESERLA